MRALTSKQLQSAEPRDTDYFLRVDRGLFLRVYPSGRKAFVYRYESDGSTRRIEHVKPFGAHPDNELSLERARVWASEQKALRIAGRDPAQTARASSLRGLRRFSVSDDGSYPEGTFGAIAHEFVVRVIERDYEHPDQVRRILKRDLLPTLGRRRIAELRLPEIQRALNAVVDRGSPIAANRTLLIAKKIFRYARTLGHIELNPLGDITRRDVGGKEGERNRALSFEEIKLVWPAVSQHKRLSWQVRACILLLLLTGQRIGETLQARWRDIDVAAGVWRLPAKTTKAKRPHLVHLPALALELLATLPRPAGAAACILHADESDAEPITRRAVTRAIHRLFEPGEGKAAALRIEAFTPHDLRRTVRSRLGDLGVPPHVVEKILNHQLGGVLQIYDRGEYLAERAHAMQLWDQKIRELLATSAPSFALSGR